jgi:hypothetical protein
MIAAHHERARATRGEGIERRHVAPAVRQSTTDTKPIDAGWR